MKIITAVVLTNLLVSFSALSAPSKYYLARAGIKIKAFDNIPYDKQRAERFIYIFR